MANHTPQELADKLRDGLLSFPVTAFDADLLFDESAYREHLSWQAGFPVAGLFAAGGTGEGFSLTPEEIATVVRVAVEEVGEKVPVLAPAGWYEHWADTTFGASASPAQNSVAIVEAASFWYPDGQTNGPLGSRGSTRRRWGRNCWCSWKLRSIKSPPRLSSSSGAKCCAFRRCRSATWCRATSTT